MLKISCYYLFISLFILTEDYVGLCFVLELFSLKTYLKRALINKKRKKKKEKKRLLWMKFNIVIFAIAKCWSLVTLVLIPSKT